jgi:hypothetical protein
MVIELAFSLVGKNLGSPPLSRCRILRRVHGHVHVFVIHTIVAHSFVSRMVLRLGLRLRL